MLESIRLWRSIAALFVVFFHSQYMINSLVGSEYFPVPFGTVGVDILFVIGGFITLYTTYDKFQQKNATSNFLRKRIIRIVPTYYLFTTVMVGLLMIAPFLFGDLKIQLHHVISSYLFLLSEDNIGNVGTVLGVGWTLTFEVFFYIIYAGLLNFKRQYLIPSLVTVFLLGNIIGLVFDDLPIWTTVFTNFMIYEFLFGCVIAVLYKNKKFINKYWSIALVTIGLLGIISLTYLDFITDSLSLTRVLSFGLPSALIVYGSLSFETHQVIRLPRLLKEIGDSSYSLYLLHSFILSAFGIFIAPALYGFKTPIFIIITLAISISVIGGIVCYYAFEKPVTEYLKRKTLPSKK